MLGIAAVLRQQVPQTLEDLVKILRDERQQITALPQAQRIALARGYMNALGVTPDDLRPIT